MEIPIKLKKKRSRTLLTIDPSNMEKKVYSPYKIVVPPPVDVSRREIAMATKEINKAISDEIEENRKKLREKFSNETDSK